MRPIPGPFIVNSQQSLLWGGEGVEVIENHLLQIAQIFMFLKSERKLHVGFICFICDMLVDDEI